MRCLLIINPISGTKSKETVAAQVTEALTRAGLELDIAYTRCAGHATTLAADAARDGFYAVIAAGGDGTVNEVAQALCGTNTRLGIIPLGSGNGLARHLCIPTAVQPALDIIISGHTVTADHCTVNGHPFFCTFGMGFDAAVSDRYAARPDHRGLANYVRCAASEFIHYKPESYTITADGQEITSRAFLIACCNASQYGNNTFVAPTASISDGMMDITVVHAGTWLGRLSAGAGMIFGSLHDSPRVSTLRARHVTIDRRLPGPAHIDGEPIAIQTHVEVECHPGTLQIFSPGEMKIRPFVTPARSAISNIKVALHAK